MENFGEDKVFLIYHIQHQEHLKLHQNQAICQENNLKLKADFSQPIIIEISTKSYKSLTNNCEFISQQALASAKYYEFNMENLGMELPIAQYLSQM